MICTSGYYYSANGQGSAIETKVIDVSLLKEIMGSHCLVLFVTVFETESHNVTQAGLE